MLGNNSGSGSSRTLGQSAVAVPLTGSTSEMTLATITIPAGAMGANGRVVIEALVSGTNSANVKTLRIKFGATTYQASTFTTSSNVIARETVANRNAANSQIGNNGSGFVNTSSAPFTSAIDTTASVDITITGQLALGTETMTLESYQVILYPKA